MRLATIAVLFCALTMIGCAQKETAADLASLRCPPVRTADVATLRKAPQKPPGGDLTDARLKRWIDGLEDQIDAKGKAGARVIYQYDRCRKAGVKSS